MNKDQLRRVCISILMSGSFAVNTLVVSTASAQMPVRPMPGTPGPRPTPPPYVPPSQPVAPRPIPPPYVPPSQPVAPRPTPPPYIPPSQPVAPPPYITPPPVRPMPGTPRPPYYPPPPPPYYPSPRPPYYPPPPPPYYPPPPPYYPSPGPGLVRSSVMINDITRNSGGEWRQIVLSPQISIDRLILSPRNADLYVHEVQLVDISGQSFPVNIFDGVMIDAYRTESSFGLMSYGLIIAINLRVESYGGYADLDVMIESENYTRLDERTNFP